MTWRTHGDFTRLLESELQVLFIQLRIHYKMSKAIFTWYTYVEILSWSFFVIEMVGQKLEKREYRYIPVPMLIKKCCLSQKGSQNSQLKNEGSPTRRMTHLKSFRHFNSLTAGIGGLVYSSLARDESLALESRDALARNYGFSLTVDISRVVEPLRCYPCY
jgi:hypothetical protein